MQLEKHAQVQSAQKKHLVCGSPTNQPAVEGRNAKTCQSLLFACLKLTFNSMPDLLPVMLQVYFGLGIDRYYTNRVEIDTTPN